MIIVLKRGASPEQAEELRCWIRCHNLEVQTTRGENQTVLVVIGDASRLDESYIEDMEIVEYVRAITQPYKLSGRNSPDDASIIDVGGVKIGGGTFTMIAGPCSVESAEQIVGIAHEVKSAPELKCFAAARSSRAHRRTAFRVCGQMDCRFLSPPDASAACR